MDKKERQKQMQSLIEQWQQSDYNQREFARMHQINYYTFRYWIAKLQKTTETPEDFVELSSPKTTTDHQLYLRYPNGVELYLPVALTKNATASKCCAGNPAALCCFTNAWRKVLLSCPINNLIKTIYQLIIVS